MRCGRSAGSSRPGAFRGTLHLLPPDDLGAYVASAGAQESWRDPAWLRYFELTEAEVEAIIRAVATVLSDRPMTRAHLADAVARSLKKPALAEKLRTGWGTYLGPAARHGHLVFGPSEGRNVTFVKPAAWLGRPFGRSARRTEAAAGQALAGLIDRYLVTFPGASRDMIRRWWGAQRAGLINDAIARLADEVARVEVDGVRAFVRAGDADAVAGAKPFRGVRLLPGFDPFTNELPRRVECVLPVALHDRVYRTAGWITPVVLVDGRVAGTWEIGPAKRAAVEVVPFGRWRGGARQELAVEVERIAAFLDRPLAVAWSTPLQVSGW